MKTMTAAEALADHLSQLVRLAGGPSAVAKRMGVSRQCVAYWAGGSLPQPGKLKALATALGLASASELIPNDLP